MHWLLVRVLSLRPALPVSDRIRAALDRQLRPEAIAAELAYFERPASRTFERPYGWGWFLRLQAELRALGARDAQAARWATACAPLADHLRSGSSTTSTSPTFPFAPARISIAHLHSSWRCSMPSPINICFTQGDRAAGASLVWA
jgi:plasmid stabilization system protein ParE